MALPTAATPGYGFYPTLGSTPDVACDCHRAWLPVFKRLCELKGYGQVVVWNCVSSLEASGNTHSGGGAVDWGGIRRDRAMLARQMGASATWPRNWTGNQHTHSVLNGCPHTSTAADHQVTACVIYRRDGLGYLGRQGPDPLPLPTPIRTWQQGIAWARAEIARIEDDMPLSNDDIAKIANAVWAKQYKSPTDGETYSAGGYLVGTAGRTSKTYWQTDTLEASVAALRKEVAALAAKVDKLA